MSRVSGQEHVRQWIHDADLEANEVVGHVLEETNGGCAFAHEHVGNDAGSIGVLCGQDVVASRVVQTRDGEVVRIQRFVYHGGVGPLPERVHQGRRDVARP